MFIGRRHEIEMLGVALSSPGATLAIVYGRRRMGKSTLIREAARKHPHVLYQATRVTSSLNLEAFKLEITRVLGPDDLLAGITDWLAVLNYLARAAEQRHGLVIILDEFPYL